MNIPILGTLALGIVVGWLTSYFLRRFKTFKVRTLGALISVLLGGAAVRFLGAEPSVLWFYPIGLLAGFGLYMIIAFLAGAPSNVFYIFVDEPEDKS